MTKCLSLLLRWYLSLKNLYKFSLIYKHKYAYLNPKNLKNWTNFKAETNRKKISFPILQCRVGPMLSSVFWKANTHLSDKCYFNISESQTYSKYYHCQANILNWSPWDIPSGATVQTASLCNWKQLDLQVVVLIASFIQKHYFKRRFIHFR